MTMLEVKDLKVSYGMIEAIKGISFEVNQGEIVSLIGSNGAGKSTTLRTISGIKPAKSGQILYEGQDILKSNAMKIVKAGISQVPEGRHVFKGMSVKENLLMGAYTRKDRDGLKEDMEKSFEYFPIIKERLNQDAATLSGGEQQMVAMARALMAKPKLLLLDEPSMGLAPLFIQQIFNIIEEINAAGTTVLLIEQNAKQALSISDRAYVMETGKILLSGTGQELLTSEKVQEAYLGGAMV
ncbi:ATP-binding cassette domain-containing protein [Aerococcus viridans]|nr:ATP-binding cassette domain-containing protein [Aerococcus viridans]